MGLRWTIYCHTHITTGRRYVGLTKLTMMKRWNQHLRNAAKKAGKGCHHFWNAIRTYGKEAFSHEVLEVCADLDVANLAEECWIEFYGTRNPEKGFNLMRGGKHVPHPAKSPWDRPEYREKCLQNLAKANAGLTPEIRSEISTRRWLDPEYRAKGLASLAKANAGCTPEIRSDRSRQLWSDPEFRDVVMASTQEAIRTPEFRKSASDRAKKMWRDPVLRAAFEEAALKRASDPVFIDAARERWNDPSFRERCSAGTRSFNEARKSASHCSKGHKYVKDDSTPSGWARECHACANERRKDARAFCPKGHPYTFDNVILSSVGFRMCGVCQSELIGPRPCSKCGLPKSRRSGNRFRCGPCTDDRIRAWKAKVGTTFRPAAR